MNISIIPLDPLLRKYIDQIFVFECEGKLAADDLKLIVPNARIKLIIPIRNGITGKLDGKVHTSHEYKITLAGITDMPAEVDIEHDAPAGNITVEFSPLGAYRFFNLKLGEATSRICNYSDIADKMTRELEERLANTPTVAAKVKLVQQFLIAQLQRSYDDPIFEFCVEQIIASNGKLPVKELERVTGYSARWLNMKFTERLGLSPKNLSSLTRFQQYYKALALNADLFFLQKDFYNYYYDQAHFIKDFKRFTGYAPLQFDQQRNDYDYIFYKE